MSQTEDNKPVRIFTPQKGYIYGFGRLLVKAGALIRGKKDTSYTPTGFYAVPDKELTGWNYLGAVIVGIIFFPIWLLAGILDEAAGNVKFNKQGFDHTFHNKKIDLMTGKEFEIYLGELFKRMGYQIKFMSKGADQGGDLVITKNGRDTLVQAKRYSVNVSNKAIQEAVAAVNYYKCYDAMIITNSEFTEAAKILAETNGIDLINGSELDKLINQYMLSEQINNSSSSKNA